MHLTIGKLQNNQLPVHIVLCFADKDHSFVEGYFYATVKDDWKNFLHIKLSEDLTTKGEFP